MRRKVAHTLSVVTALLVGVSFLAVAATASAAPRVIAPRVKDVRVVATAVHAAVVRHVELYRIRAGDTLSSIAKRTLGSADLWPRLWWDNRHKITDPNVIRAHMIIKLAVARKAIPAWMLDRADNAMQTYIRPALAAAGSHVAQAVAPKTYTGGSSAFEQCVIQRESGGDPTAYNASSGASGLFGFLLSTWDSLGIGYPGGAYTAPASVQVQGFWKLYGEDGGAPWNADGCPQQFGLDAYSATEYHGKPAGGGRHGPRRVAWRIRALRWARTQAGTSYCWGGTGPSCYDCSGLVMMAYRHAGVRLPRTAAEIVDSPMLRRVIHPRKGDIVAWFSGGSAFHVELFVRGRLGRGLGFGAFDYGHLNGLGSWNAAWGWAPGAAYRVVR